ncbi:crotonase/enoyl-CoA hydratase family protein [Myceligenerans pegani]|uniref:Crotonase/enoyl-CoA hydratase family protein n=1 Tax=Myceligenerans pegani TaxID=2776917 RepID=A0ABR9N0I2_9MICO|nr:crotonase/enoyl-CoA hydratase family protein [Myceligenerans sp. TRM 65318]MBE1877142.1 crotonase/enoyl-CoA hydratase family protein [Myceligenerans sp. TRM 65318]MBE3019413.1 crotonase/enoyl-CoA hydratase family protein [Myceligenerans sp. TRM 65318]
MSHIACTVDDDAVAHVRLDRPDKLNALTLDMLADLAATARRLRRAPGLRAVVLSGEGRSFGAGLDLAAAARNPAGVARAFVPTWRGTNRFQEACRAWRRLPVPVIAAVHGHVLGGALQLALGADLRITTPDARWCVMEVARGLVPDMSGIQALSELTGLETATRLTLTAEEFSGTDAVRFGLAGSASPDPLADARALAETIAGHRPEAVRAAKRLLNRTWGQGPRRTFAAERAAQLRLLSGAMPGR